MKVILLTLAVASLAACSTKDEKPADAVVVPAQVPVADSVAARGSRYILISNDQPPAPDCVPAGDQLWRCPSGTVTVQTKRK